jgi:hypothetical protein
MKTTLNYFVVLGTIFFLASCSTFKYTSRVAETQTNNNIYITPSVVDVKIDFSKKITAVSDQQKTEEGARENAYYKAIKDNSIDILISPIYEMETQTSTNKSKVTVTGYAGYFVNSRTLAEEKKNTFEAKLNALDKMLKLDPIVKEEQKTVILMTGTNSGSNNNNNTDNTKLFTTISTSAPSLIDKFVILYGTDGNGGANTIKNNNPASQSFTSSVGNLVNSWFKK